MSNSGKSIGSGHKMGQDMDTTIDIEQALKVIKNVADNTSWFRGNPHHWATASLPLAYAVACVEVVSKKSNETRAVYQQLVEAWGKIIGKGIDKSFCSVHNIPRCSVQKVI